MEVHELDEGRRYLSTRVDEGFELVIFTTPISRYPVWKHEQILDKKVNEYVKQRDCFVPRNDGDND